MGGQSTIQNNGEVWEIRFKSMDDVVAQGRHFSIFFWTQTIEPGISSMHNKKSAARGRDLADKVANKVIPFLPPQANSVFDCYWD